jgi:esterase/lipase superfamily enzyme
VKTEHHRWHSPALGKAMDLLVFGHGGAKLLVFPTSMGTFTEWADRRMHEVLRDHIEQGWIQMICVDQVNSESWNADTIHPGARAWRHLQYDAYLKDEVVPFMGSVNSNPFIIATGASLGAYQAAAFGLRHPHIVSRIIGMSGLYDIKRLTGGYSDQNVYQSNPMDFIVHEHDQGRLEALQRQDIIIAIGKDDPSIHNNREFSGILWNRGIGHALREWDGWSHDWPYWERMIRAYVGGHD